MNEHDRDQLTGLYTRHFLYGPQVRQALREQAPVSFIMADINGMKLINDVFGHERGNDAIRRAVRIIEGVCRKNTDLILRMGGDEFLVIVPYCDAACAAQIIERIRSCCEEGEECAEHSTLALGSETDDGRKTLDEMLVLADQAMYRNKLAGSTQARSYLERHIEAVLAASVYEPPDHTRRLLDMAKRMTAALSLSPDEAQRLSLLCRFHDMGKLAVPEEILCRQGPLSPEEEAVLRGHAEKGYNIARGSFHLTDIARAVLAHHERFDGTGYPLGLSGGDIPFITRTLSVLHAYDDLTQEMGASPAQALWLLKEQSGKAFDPGIVRAFEGICGDLL